MIVAWPFLLAQQTVRERGAGVHGFCQFHVPPAQVGVVSSRSRTAVSTNECIAPVMAASAHLQCAYVHICASEVATGVSTNSARSRSTAHPRVHCVTPAKTCWTNHICATGV